MSDPNAWYYRLMGDVVGPITSKALRELAKNGSIDLDTQVRKGPDGNWVSAASVKGLFPPQPDKSDFPPLVPFSVSFSATEIEHIAESQNHQSIPPNTNPSPIGSTSKSPSEGEPPLERLKENFKRIDPEFWAIPKNPFWKPKFSIKEIGLLFVVIGIALLIGFTFYDTTVGSDGSERVYNIGLQQNRLLGFVAGIAATMLGAVLITFSKTTVNHDSKNGVLKSSDSSNQTSNQTNEIEKDCPFCAEKIKANAKKCKHCGEFLP